MTNQHMQPPSPPPAVERAADDQPVPPPPNSSPAHLGGTAHSHLHSHLRRRFGHSHSHSHSSSSSPSTSTSDLELENNIDNDNQNKDADNSSTSNKNINNNTRLDDSYEDDQLKELREADADAQQPDSKDTLVHREVETVSLVRIVDGLGQTIDTQLIYPSTNTASDPTNTGDISAPGSSGTAASGANPGASDNVSPPPYPTTPRSTVPQVPSSLVTPSETTQQPTGTPISSLVTGSGTASNTSFTSMPKNSTMTSTTSSSTHTTPSSTTTSHSTSLSSTSSDLSSILSSISSKYTMAVIDPSPTAGYDVGSGSGTSGDSGQPSTTEAAGDSGSGGGGVVLSQQQKQIVGGVVGGVAGAALFFVLILMALKWKHRRSEVQELIGERGVASRSLDGPGGNGGPGTNSMSERALPFGAAGALAGFAGRKSQTSADTATAGEKGFYRVSGRKLPSVLQHGGDGFSDPRPPVPTAGGTPSPDLRHSAGSANTDWYRGSQAFEPAAGAPLSLGSPMRPVSGVVIMRDGPAKTPVTEQNPFADPPSPSNFPLPPEGLGVAYGSPAHDPRGSPSKFQEYVR